MWECVCVVRWCRGRRVAGELCSWTGYWAAVLGCWDKRGLLLERARLDSRQSTATGSRTRTISIHDEKANSDLRMLRCGEVWRRADVMAELELELELGAGRARNRYWELVLVVVVAMAGARLQAWPEGSEGEVKAVKLLPNGSKASVPSCNRF